MKRTIHALSICLLCALFSISSAQAQKLTNLSIGVTSQSFTLPFLRFWPSQSGLELGTTVYQTTKNNADRFVNVYVGGYHIRSGESAFYVRSEYNYQHKINDKFALDLPLGLGYQQTYLRRGPGTQNPITGEWEKEPLKSRPHLLATFALGLTYTQPQNVHPFIRYEGNLDIPLYNSYVSTRTFIKMGIIILLNTAETD